MGNKNTKKQDPLKKLYLDQKSIDRELLAELLVDFVGIDQTSLEPIFKKAYYELREKDKILVYLLYKRALTALGRIKEENMGEMPKKISKETGVNYNSVRGYLSQLSRENMLGKRKLFGGYFILSSALFRIKKEFEIKTKKI